MSPRKIEMIAGGASLAPRRWSLDAEAMETRRRSAWRATAWMAAGGEGKDQAGSWAGAPGVTRVLPLWFGIDQVGPGEVEVLVDQEVLKLGSAGGVDLGRVLAEQLQDSERLLRQGFHRAEQRGLLVERLAGPRAERGRDAEGGAVGVLEDEGRAGRVPRGVAAGLERSADA